MQGSCNVRHVVGAFAVFALSAVAVATHAADNTFPARPVRVIVGFTPGGGSDVAARIVGQKLSDLWKQPVVVDKRPGDGGNLATELVSHANPDGYTLLLAGSSFAIQHSSARKLPFDTIRDFKGVSNLCASPFVLAVSAATPAKSVKELIALAQAKPGSLNYASAGTGSTVHLAVELFRGMANIDIVHVPYKGATYVTDLLSGSVQMTITAPVVVMPHVKTGRLRALGVTSTQRTVLVPDVPTIAESGLKGYEVESWYGLVVPSGTPAAVVKTLNAGILQVLDRADVKQQLLVQALETRPTSPAAFDAYIKADIAKWESVIKTNRIRIE